MGLWRCFLALYMAAEASLLPAPAVHNRWEAVAARLAVEPTHQPAGRAKGVMWTSENKLHIFDFSQIAESYRGSNFE